MKFYSYYVIYEIGSEKKMETFASRKQEDSFKSLCINNGWKIISTSKTSVFPY